MTAVDRKRRIYGAGEKEEPKGSKGKEMELFVWGTGRLAGKVIGRHVQLESVKAFIDNDLDRVICFTTTARFCVM